VSRWPCSGPPVSVAPPPAITNGAGGWASAWGCSELQPHAGAELCVGPAAFPRMRRRALRGSRRPFPPGASTGGRALAWGCPLRPRDGALSAPDPLALLAVEGCLAGLLSIADARWGLVPVGDFKGVSFLVVWSLM